MAKNLCSAEWRIKYTDIAKNSDVGWSILHQFWSSIVKLGIVTKTRRIGRAELYKLNANSPIVKKLIELDMDVSKKLLSEQINGKMKVTA